jgi:hypothetical protein
MTLQEFLSAHKFGISSVAVPNFSKEKSYKYHVSIELAGKGTTLEFTKGLAHVGYRVDDKWVTLTWQELKKYEKKTLLKRAQPIPPQLDEVMSCVQSDCRCVCDNIIWEDFANEMGMNPDSIKDRRVYEACQEQYKKFRDLMGRQLFLQFIACENNY